MSDDRFEKGSTVYKRDPIKSPWGSTLEDALVLAISKGSESEILLLIKLLPEEKKSHYREIYRKAKSLK